ncbi:MAG: retroviral-like aspartic protease family protein [Caulobacteraceae bacterium]|nr:retroviral-like aspartic protease family protein [Caulobacteraceae bacterium]
MLTRRAITQALGLGLGGAGLPLNAFAQAPDAPAASGLASGSSPPPVVDPDDAEFNASFDPSLRMLGAVSVEDRGPHQFVVDTGANRSVIAEDLARSLGLAAGPRITLHGIAGAEDVPTALVPRFEVGGIVSHNLQMPVLPRRRLGADGLLGLDALANRAVELDFRRHRVRLFRSRVRTVGSSRLTPDTRQPGAVVNAKYRFGQLTIVLARAGNSPVTAFIDSGSQATVGNSALLRAVATRKLAVPGAGRIVPIYSVTSQVAYGQFEVVRLLTFGGDARLRNLPVIFSDLHTFDLWGLRDTPALLIGADSLSAFSQVTLDFGRHEVVFNP